MTGGAKHPPTISAAYDAAAGYVNHVPASALVAAVHEGKRASEGDLMKRIAELERQLAKGDHGGGPARGGKGRESNPDLGNKCFFCQKMNHVAKNCRLRLKKVGQAERRKGGDGWVWLRGAMGPT